MMRRTAASLAVAALCVALTGCETVRYETLNKWHHEPIPKTLLTKCVITPPPKAKEYMALSKDDRELALAKRNHELTASLRTCNVQLEGVEKWDKDVAESVAKKNAENAKVK